MKQLLFIIVGVIIAVSAIAFAFTLTQANQQQLSLTADLQYRTHLLADSLKESVELYYTGHSTEALQKIVDKFANRERLVGLAVYDNKEKPVATSAGLPQTIIDQPHLVSDVMDRDEPRGNFLKIDGKSMYVFVEPLRQNDTVVGAFMLAQNASYIDSSVNQIWGSNLFRLLVQVFLFSTIVILLVRWIIFKPINRLAESIKSARTGRSDDFIKPIKGPSFFKPLAHEISKISQSLLQARSSASEEARMRMEKLDTPWTAERLKEFTKAHLKDREIFVVSNREPYIHNKVKNKIFYSMTAHGMITAIEPMMKACGGLWLAHGSGTGDRQTVDEHNKIAVPPDEPKYTLKRVWLSDADIQGYYVGFANEALYPLCLHTHTRPVFRKEDWLAYKRVNGIFAESLLAEIKNISQPLVLIQDFHFALLPQMIKANRPDAQVVLFWHITWPSAEQFSICPWRKEILEGMLGADVIGFHTQQHCNNFIETIGKEVEALIDLERFSISRGNHLSYIKPFPVSVAFTNGLKDTASEGKPNKNSLPWLKVKTKYIGLGVDRLDYTKGIIERLKGLETFLDAHPHYKKQLTFVQIAPESREVGEKNREYNKAVTEEVQRINKKFKIDEWEPIVLEKEYHPHEELNALYRLANFCLITSLHDGMNLVAKEFVAARHDEAGVIILSQFAGASRDLTGALIVNPYSAEEIAETIYKALAMSPTEQHRRMKSMRNSVKNYNIYRWAAELIKSIVSLG
ncbi:MAG: trehalose-6-phosphate synthase [Candidatus Taylorbacteria bacterium]|nr:trehalose-6-phosphate synthase [Candidatus Taylorbacteria bacterium]